MPTRAKSSRRTGYAHLRGTDPKPKQEVDESFVWPYKLCHTQEAILRSTWRDRGLMPAARHNSPTRGEFVAEFGRNLQRERLAKGMSQEHLAYVSGLSRYTYQKYEKGESRPGTSANPSLLNVLALAQALGVELTALLPSEWPDFSAR